MKRTAAVLATSIVAAMTLAGCGGGGGGAYCDAVDAGTSTLNTFGQKRTNAAYAKYSATFKKVAASAPSAVKKDWTTLASVTDKVIAAQKDVGLALEDMTDQAKVKTLSQAQLKKLNTAYEAFNSTTAQRTAVVKNVKQECKITLK